MITALKARVLGAFGFNPLALEKARVRMNRRVDEYLSEIPFAPTSGPDTLVVVAPWEGTYTPWYTLAVALLMAGEGARVRFVLDDVPDGGSMLRHRLTIRALRSVLHRLSGRFEVLQLSDFPPSQLREEDRQEIKRLAGLNATWALRGEMPQEGRQYLIDRNITQTSLALGHIITLFREIETPEMLFTPGGVFGASGLWMAQARERGIRVASFDTGGYETAMLAANGMACQLDDVPIAYRILQQSWRNDTEDRAFALALADEEIAKRRDGSDAFSSQVSGAKGGGGELEGGVLVALNSSWDAAALGPHCAYPDNTTWIVETVRTLLEKTDRPVIVRQHPAERLAIAATSENYRLMLSREFGENERLYFIAAEDPINSYDLLEKVRAVVVHTSTIGIEAAAFGRPVVTGSNAYYSDLGFVERSTTRSAYEDLLLQAATGAKSVTLPMREDAKLCFYITQCRNWVFSKFNPGDFPQWIDRPLSHWQKQPTVARMIESLITGIPVAVLNHRAANERENSRRAESR